MDWFWNEEFEIFRVIKLFYHTRMVLKYFIFWCTRTAQTGEYMETPNGFSKIIADGRYGQAPKLKLTKVKYRKDMETCYRKGMIEAASRILEAHNKGEYESMDVMVGDLQVIIHDNLNAINDFFGFKPVDTISLENIIDDVLPKVPRWIKKN